MGIAGMQGMHWDYYVDQCTISAVSFKRKLTALQSRYCALHIAQVYCLGAHESVTVETSLKIIPAATKDRSEVIQAVALGEPFWHVPVMPVLLW